MSKDLFFEMRQEEREADHKQELATVPNTEVSVSTKNLLDLTKDDLRRGAMAIVESIKDGETDALQTLIAVKKATLYFKELEDNVKTIVYNKQPVSKGEILSLHGVDVEQANFSSWDYSKCNDSQLLYYKSKVKEREILLQTLTKPSEQVDIETGECYIANPAIKLTTDGVKITIK